MSRKPRVVIMPVLASWRSSTALVVVVVPWTMRSMSPTANAGLGERRDARRTAWLSAVVGDLGDADLAAVAPVDQDQVGEGAADIDAGDDVARGFARCLIFLNHARNPKRRI